MDEQTKLNPLDAVASRMGWAEVEKAFWNHAVSEWVPDGEKDWDIHLHYDVATGIVRKQSLRKPLGEHGPVGSRAAKDPEPHSVSAKITRLNTGNPFTVEITVLVDGESHTFEKTFDIEPAPAPDPPVLGDNIKQAIKRYLDIQGHVITGCEVHYDAATDSITTTIQGRLEACCYPVGKLV